MGNVTLHDEAPDHPGIIDKRDGEELALCLLISSLVCGIPNCSESEE